MTSTSYARTKLMVFSGTAAPELFFFFNITNQDYLISNFEKHRERHVAGKTPAARGRYCFSNLVFETSQSNSSLESGEAATENVLQRDAALR